MTWVRVSVWRLQENRSRSQDDNRVTSQPDTPELSLHSRLGFPVITAEEVEISFFTTPYTTLYIQVHTGLDTFISFLATQFPMAFRSCPSP